MALLKEEKNQILKQFQRSDLDTGSSEVQIALLTQRILTLTEHFKAHKKDNHSRRGLINMVSRRRKLLAYVKKNNFTLYSKIISDLGLRK